MLLWLGLSVAGGWAIYALLYDTYRNSLDREGKIL